MDDRFLKIDDKLDKICDRLADIDKSVAVYNEQLKLHIEGTVQNREQLRLFREKVEADLTPVKKHVVFVEVVFKALGALSLIVGILAGLSKLQ